MPARIRLYTIAYNSITMFKFVLDADGAIKLAKADSLESLCLFADCYLPTQAFTEILKGKEKMFEDAFIIERLVKENKIKVLHALGVQKRFLGGGETMALALFRKLGADAIISDDRRFLSLCEQEKVPFLIPTDAIVFLAVKKAFSKTDAINCLSKIRHLVREENYISAIKSIGGE